MNPAGNGWTTLFIGPQSDVVLSTSNVISDTVSLVHTGGDLSGWVNPTTELIILTKLWTIFQVLKFVLI